MFDQPHAVEQLASLSEHPHVSTESTNEEEESNLKQPDDCFRRQGVLLVLVDHLTETLRS